MTNRPQQRLGDLNGRYAFIFKCFLVLLPILLGLDATWRIWTTRAVYALQADMKTTLLMADAIRDNSAAIRANSLAISENAKAVAEKIASLPPTDWRERIQQLERDMRQNVQDHVQIIVSLEQIKAKLGVTEPRS